MPEDFFWQQNENEKFLKIEYVNANGFLQKLDDSTVTIIEQDVSNRSYYTEAMKKNRGLMSPFPSQAKGEEGLMMVVYSVPVMKNKEVLGVLIAVSNADFLSQITNTIELRRKPVLDITHI